MQQAKISVSSADSIETTITTKFSDKIEDALVTMTSAVVQQISGLSEATPDKYDVEQIVKTCLNEALERMAGYTASDAEKLAKIRERYSTDIVEMQQKTESLNAQCDLIVAEQRLKAITAGEPDPMTKSRY